MPVQYDLVITGDRVIDPANGLNGAAQVAVKDGKIAAVAERLPPHNVEKSVDAIGKIVCPGLIDMHVQVYEWVTNCGLPANAEGETLKVNERLVPALVYREGREFIPNRRLLRDICQTDQLDPVLS